jgi:hypothetical protein
VRRGIKVVIWTGVFVVCAGAGAYVAAHTNPFPPGVEDPGARPTSPPPTSPTPSAQRWDLVMTSLTRHMLHVGGACRSSWRTSGVIAIAPGGAVTGRARARVRSWGCDFTVAQVQTRTITLDVSGSLSAQMVLRFSPTGSRPTGSQDLGGFVATLPKLRPAIDASGGHGVARASAAKPDGGLGRYVNVGRIQLACATGC